MPCSCLFTFNPTYYSLSHLWKILQFLTHRVPVYVVTSDNGNASDVDAKAFIFTQRPWSEQSFGQLDRSQAAPENPSKHSHSPVSRLQSPLRTAVAFLVLPNIEKEAVEKIYPVVPSSSSIQLMGLDSNHDLIKEKWILFDSWLNAAEVQKHVGIRNIVITCTPYGRTALVELYSNNFSTRHQPRYTEAVVV